MTVDSVAIITDISPYMLTNALSHQSSSLKY